MRMTKPPGHLSVAKAGLFLNKGIRRQRKAFFFDTRAFLRSGRLPVAPVRLTAAPAPLPIRK
jgi:hypothetical protein